MKIFLDANICLDLLDTTRPTSGASVAWYMQHKGDERLTFYFSGDFITTFYYVLTERKKRDKQKVVKAIDALSMEIYPFYLEHADFIEAKKSFYADGFEDFEDLMILYSAVRSGSTRFVTHDARLGSMGRFAGMEIERIR